MSNLPASEDPASSLAALGGVLINPTLRRITVGMSDPQAAASLASTSRFLQLEVEGSEDLWRSLGRALIPIWSEHVVPHLEPLSTQSATVARLRRACKQRAERAMTMPAPSRYVAPVDRYAPPTNHIG